jgi:hypothetical protein
MKAHLRPTSINDMSKVRELLGRAHGTSLDAPFLDPSLMAWKYWERREDWEGPRSYVLEIGDAIVAHAGIFPLTFDGGEVRGAHLIDWASGQESPGAGFTLLQRLGTRFDFLYAIGGTKTARKIVPALGFQEYASQWKGARPIRPLQQILTHPARNWKLAPRLIRNSLWAWRKSPESLLRGEWKAEEINPDQVSREFYSQSMGESCFSPRPPGFFEYLLRCPAMQIKLYGIRNKQGVQGHFAIGVMRAQARVAGVWLREPDPETWQAAFSLAQETASRLKGACEILVAGTTGPSEQAAIKSGLRVMGHTPVYLLNKKGKLALPPDFQFQLSDRDVLFLDPGTSAYVT